MLNTMSLYVKLFLVFAKTILQMFGSVFAGYLIVDMDPKFLRSFKNPINIFFIGLLLSALSLNYNLLTWQQGISTVIASSVIFTILILLLKKYIGTRT